MRGKLISAVLLMASSGAAGVWAAGPGGPAGHSRGAVEGVANAVAVAAVGPQQKDYLSEEEADKIREARMPDAKVKLFLNFAADRLKKFQYEQERTAPEYHKDEMLNGLLNAYSGCIDDAADIISLSMEKQEDIRAGVKDMQTRAKGFLVTLKAIESKGLNLEAYKETLDDAIEGTQDALQDIQNDLKEMTPPPTRRPQS